MKKPTARLLRQVPAAPRAALPAALLAALLLPLPATRAARAADVASLAKALADPAPRLREEARRTLRRLTHHAARPGARDEAKRLARELAGTLAAARDARVKSSLLDLLALVGDADSVPAVTASLQSRETRDAAIRALVRIPAPAAAQALREALESAAGDDAAAQVPLIHAMGAKQDSAAAQLLADLVANARLPEVRLAAAEALARNPLAYAYAQTIWDLLPSGKPTAGNARLRRRVRDCLLRAGEAYIEAGEVGSASDFFRDLLEASTSREERCAAIAGLAAASRREAPELVLAATRDKDPVVRATAIDGLGSLRWGMLSPELAQLLRAAPPARKAEILRALARREEPGAALAAAPLLDAPDAGVRAAALEVFEGRSSAAVARPLIDVLCRQGPAATEGAAGVLARMPGDDVTQALAGAAKTASPRARAAIEKILSARRAVRSSAPEGS